MFGVLGDVRYATRLLRRHPGFTFVAVLSLATGIGPNTAIFSVLDTVLLKKLAARDPDRLVSLKYTQPHGGTSGRFSYAAYQQIRDGSHSLAGVFAHDATIMALSIDGPPEMTRGAFVSGSYYQVLGVAAAAGRVLMPADDRPGAGAVAVIRYEYWQRRFGLSPSALNRIIHFKGVPFTIVGVTPPGFTGYNMLDPADVTIPFIWQSSLGLKDHTSFGIIARLQHGVSEETASAELTVIFRQSLRHAAGTRLSAEREHEIAAQSIRLTSASHGLWDIQADYQFRLLLLMGVVGLLLLTACANLASLLLARASGRQREIAVRLAIGAGRRRLIRQMLTESLLLAVLGGLLGLGLAAWCGGALPKLLGLDINLAWSPRLFVFTAAVAMLTGVGFGLAPALRASVLEPSLAMRGAAGGRTAGRGIRIGQALVIVQVAVSCALLIGTGLLVRTVYNLQAVDPGFRSDHILLVWIYPTLAGYEGSMETAFYDRLLHDTRSIPGVQNAAIARHSMMQGNDQADVYVPGQAAPSPASYNAIAPGFFETMGIHFLRGRDFSPADVPGGPLVAIVNENFAREHFDANATGKLIRIGGPQSPLAEIVGVVRNTRYRSLRQEPKAPPGQVFVPYTQAPADELGQMSMIIRAPYAADVPQELRRRLAAIDPRVPLGPVTTQQEQVAKSMADERAMATLTAAFGAMALLLASIGLYGTISYSVSRRTSEIGVRMALGAQATSVIRLVLGETLALAVAGIAIGLAVALGCSRVISSLLFGVTGSDAPTLTLALLVVLASAALAGYFPAKRAARVTPIAALHYE